MEERGGERERKSEGMRGVWEGEEGKDEMGLKGRGERDERELKTD